MIDYAACVKRGAALLDRKAPGWEREIKAELLNLRSSCNCVLGHLYGRYINGLACLDIDHMTESENLGFVIEPGNTNVDRAMQDAYAELTRQWLAEICSRFQSVPPAPAIGPPVPAGAEVLELQFV